MVLDELLRRTRKAGYVVRDFKNPRGSRIISVESADGSVWSRTVFCPDDSEEILAMKEEMLRARCENYIKNPYEVKIIPKIHR